MDLPDTASDAARNGTYSVWQICANTEYTSRFASEVKPHNAEPKQVDLTKALLTSHGGTNCRLTIPITAISTAQQVHEEVARATGQQQWVCNDY